MPGNHNNYPFGNLFGWPFGTEDHTQEEIHGLMMPRRIPVPTGTVGDIPRPLDREGTPPPATNHLYDLGADTPPRFHGPRADQLVFGPEIHEFPRVRPELHEPQNLPPHHRLHNQLRQEQPGAPAFDVLRVAPNLAHRLAEFRERLANGEPTKVVVDESLAKSRAIAVLVTLKNVWYFEMVAKDEEESIKYKEATGWECYICYQGWNRGDDGKRDEPCAFCNPRGNRGDGDRREALSSPCQQHRRPSSPKPGGRGWHRRPQTTRSRRMTASKIKSDIAEASGSRHQEGSSSRPPEGSGSRHQEVSSSRYSDSPEHSEGSSSRHSEGSSSRHQDSSHDQESPRKKPRLGAGTIDVNKNKYTGIKALPCGHLGHEECLLRWFRECLECPYCRAPVTDPGNRRADRHQAQNRGGAFGAGVVHRHGGGEAIHHQDENDDDLYHNDQGNDHPGDGEGDAA